MQFFCGNSGADPVPEAEGLREEAEILAARIRKAFDAYWAGSPEISDLEYDAALRKLKLLAPEHPLLDELGAPQVSALREIRLSDPMISLDKVYSFPELLAWAKSFARSDRDELLLVQPKYDGISCRYDGTMLVTRGKGETGQDITDKLPLIELETADYTGPVNRPARGELLIRPDRFEKLRAVIRSRGNTVYRNTRNVLTGFMMLKSSRETEQLLLAMKRTGGFLTLVDYGRFSEEVPLSRLEESWESLTERIRTLPYPMDGIVVKFADPFFRRSLGSTAHHPRGEMAYKFVNARAESILENVQWSFGKNCLTPVAEIRPVELGGTTIKRATLHNAKNIADMDLQIGDTVVVERAGDVIPHIVSRTPGAVRRSALIDVCPGCGTKLIWKGPELACPDPECFETRLCRLAAAVRALDADNLGDATLRQIMKQFSVRSLKDLLSLGRSDFVRLERFGAKSAENLAESLAKARKCDDFRLLAALNIPNVGVNVAKLLLREYSFSELRNLPEETLSEIRGIGPERAAALRRTFAEDSVLIDELLEAVDLRSGRGQGEGKTVCFTGKMPEKRSFYEKIARSYGWEIAEQVTENLTLLVAADPLENGTKLERARKRGTEIVSTEEFLKRFPLKETDSGASGEADNGQLSLF